jgi:hypothetical protein
MTSPHGFGIDEMRLRIGYSPMSMVHPNNEFGVSRQNFGTEQVCYPMKNSALIMIAGSDCYLDEELAKRVLEAEYEDGSLCPVRGWFDPGSPAVPSTSIFFWAGKNCFPGTTGWK